MKLSTEAGMTEAMGSVADALVDEVRAFDAMFAPGPVEQP